MHEVIFSPCIYMLNCLGSKSPKTQGRFPLRTSAYFIIHVHSVVLCSFCILRPESLELLATFEIFLSALWFDAGVKGVEVLRHTLTQWSIRDSWVVAIHSSVNVSSLFDSICNHLFTPRFALSVLQSILWIIVKAIGSPYAVCPESLPLSFFMSEIATLRNHCTSKLRRFSPLREEHSPSGCCKMTWQWESCI